MSKIQINKELMRRIMAGALALTGLVSLAGCGNDKKEEEPTTQIVQSTQEFDLSHFGSLKGSEQQDIKKIFAGLHIPDGFLKNDDIVFELEKAISETEGYVSTVDFMKKEAYSEYYPISYHTSDGKMSFVDGKEDGYSLFVKEYKDNNLVVREIKFDADYKTQSVEEKVYCNENGSAFSSDTEINNWGCINPTGKSDITYVTHDFLNKTPSIFSLYRDKGSEALYFYSAGNLVSFSSGDDMSQYGYQIELSDEEKLQLMINFNNHSNEQLLALQDRLVEKYKGNYYSEFCDCIFDCPNNDKHVSIYINKSKKQNNLNVSIGPLWHDYTDDLSEAEDDLDEADAVLELECNITDEQYDTLKDYAVRKDEKIIPYIKQLDLEHKAEVANNVEQAPAKLYIKK